MVTWQPGMTLADLEREAILSAYRLFEHNKTRTANALGITVKTLYNKLEKYGVLKPTEESAVKNGASGANGAQAPSTQK